MDRLSALDDRQLAIVTARARIVVGLAFLLVPGIAARMLLGDAAASASVRFVTRMLGIREVVIGVGTLTSVKEHAQGPEWLGMAAVCDGVDAALLVAAPGVPRWARPFAVVPALVAALQLRSARRLADERDAVAEFPIG